MSSARKGGEATNFAGLAGMEPDGPRKSVGDYAKALKRRAWLVLLVALLFGGGGTLFTLFVQSRIYLANAVVRIEPPKALTKDQTVGMNPALATGYFNTRVEMIASRKVAEQVIRELKLSDWSELHGFEDPIAELMGWIRVKPRKNSNLVDVSLEGRDPQIVSKIVTETVRTFQRFENDGLDKSGTDSAKQIRKELEAADGRLKAASEAVIRFKQANRTFIYGQKTEEEMRLEELQRQKATVEGDISTQKLRLVGLESLMKTGAAPMSLEAQKLLGQIQEEIAAINQELNYYKARLKPQYYERNAVVASLVEQRTRLEEQSEGIGQGEYDLEKLRIGEMIKFQEENGKKLAGAIAAQQEAVAKLLEPRKMLAGLENAEATARSRVESLNAEMARALSQSSLTAAQIVIEEEAVVPRTPIRPILWLQIPLLIAGGLLLGALTVIGLEMIDGTIRDPDAARDAMSWPLLGVVPKLARREMAAWHGKTALASELPGTQACEAFRNLRMSLVGAEGAERRRTILVASPKPGEGKSLVAANLAAACARAGETVCLVDVDLRQPSAAEFFDVPADAPGLVEALEGAAPWPRTLLESDVPNLYVMPVGNADGAPLDMLGTLEMHDLLQELAGKFDRVILDGPAILGLADGRAVGRFVDGVLLVMRSGSHDAKPLARVREIFDHEGLQPLGIVFNGHRERHDDLATTTPNYRPRRREPQRAPAPTAGEKFAGVADSASTTEAA
jgi:capsular exopolysaccharide synthesis family protein